MDRKRNVRKVLILIVIIVVASAAVALASWLIANWIRSDDEANEQKGSTAGDTATAWYNDPDRPYTNEVKKCQNFFKALGEGRVERLDVTATDYQPAGDPNSSYLDIIITTTDSAESEGVLVMEYADGLWHIAEVNLSGNLAGGANRDVPDSFEDELEREVVENQHFLRKTAEGRLAYLQVGEFEKIGEDESLLIG